MTKEIEKVEKVYLYLKDCPMFRGVKTEKCNSWRRWKSGAPSNVDLSDTAHLLWANDDVAAPSHYSIYFDEKFDS